LEGGAAAGGSFKEHNKKKRSRRKGRGKGFYGPWGTRSVCGACPPEKYWDFLGTNQQRKVAKEGTESTSFTVRSMWGCVRQILGETKEKRGRNGGGEGRLRGG